jgi:SagB-type dehydrogenase family enzyme
VVAEEVVSRLRLRRDATVGTPEPGAIRLEFPGGEAAWRGLPAGVCAAVRALAGGDQSEVDLGVLVTGSDGFAGLGKLHAILARLDGAGMLEHAVSAAGRELARLRPVGRGRLVRAPSIDPDTPVKLSRFALARAAGGTLVVAAPDSFVQLEVADASLLGRLADWAPAGSYGPVLRLFADAGLLAADESTMDSAQWTVPDLWLHARSRGTNLSASYGGGYPLAGRFDPLPAAPAPRAYRIPLAVPDLAVAAKQDPPLTEVLEARRSVREHDAAAPITAEELAELLYRTVRIRGTFAGEHGLELVDRPYPAGGSIHELEVYPLVTNVAGVDAGLWHYHAADHHLELVAEPGPATRTLVEQAKAASTMTEDPQVLLIVAARFGRLMWKYDTIAYALLLKHVGVLYQTVYLVGTAMGLAVCGLGGGDAAGFATASGLDYRTEGSVGELAVGSRR